MPAVSSQSRILTVTFIWLISILIFKPQVEAALLALPSGEMHHMIWERVLVVYDSLSEQQTVIGEAAITGSPSQFAILTATPKAAIVNYTTTRIWKRLRPYINQKVLKKRVLSFAVYSWIWHLIKSPVNPQPDIQKNVDVLKSRDTQVHIQERALHEWLISRGLSLTPEQALSIKKVYEQGLAVTALYVKPPHGKLKDQIQETWTSTWVFSHEVNEPRYLSLFPTPLRLSTEKIALSSQLKLTFISDQPVIYAVDKWNREKESREHQVVGVQKVLSRVEIGELNRSLSTQNWSFNRRGVLNMYELTAPNSLARIKGYAADKNQVRPLPPKIVPQNYVLALPIELTLLLLYVLGVIIRIKR